MDYCAGIDVSLELSSVCVVDSSGKIVRETKVASEPEALLQHFADLRLPVIRVGLEAGPLSQWLREGLVDAGFEVVLLETRHVKAALSAMPVKTDRKDASRDCAVGHLEIPRHRRPEMIHCPGDLPGGAGCGDRPGSGMLTSGMPG
jgi:transposase